MQLRFIRTCFLICAIVGALAPQRSEAVAPQSTCPQIWNFFRVGDLDLYALTFRASTSMKIDASIALYAGGDELSTDVHDVAIDKPTDTLLAPLRSTTIVLPEQQDEKQTTLLVHFTGAYATCPDEGRLYTVDRSPRTRDDGPLGAYKTLLQATRAESLTAQPLDMQLQQNVAPPCADTQTDAQTKFAAAVSFGDTIQHEAENGTTVVIVDIDRSGNVRAADIYRTSFLASYDAAAKRAAILSTYRPAQIGCTAVGGVYDFVVDFQNR